MSYLPVGIFCRNELVTKPIPFDTLSEEWIEELDAMIVAERQTSELLNGNFDFTLDESIPGDVNNHNIKKRAWEEEEFEDSSQDNYDNFRHDQADYEAFCGNTSSFFRPIKHIARLGVRTSTNYNSSLVHTVTSGTRAPCSSPTTPTNSGDNNLFDIAPRSNKEERPAKKMKNWHLTPEMVEEIMLSLETNADEDTLFVEPKQPVLAACEMEENDDDEDNPTLEELLRQGRMKKWTSPAVEGVVGVPVQGSWMGN